MSHDPQSPSDRRDREPDNACPRCGALDCSPNVEAFEEFGDVMCDDCADAAFAADELSDEGDPDEAQEWADFDRDC